MSFTCSSCVPLKLMNRIGKLLGFSKAIRSSSACKTAQKTGAEGSASSLMKSPASQIGSVLASVVSTDPGVQCSPERTAGLLAQLLMLSVRLLLTVHPSAVFDACCMQLEGSRPWSSI